MELRKESKENGKKRITRKREVGVRVERPCREVMCGEGRGCPKR